MEYILHIDTSGDTGVVALSGDGNVLAVRTNVDTRNHAAVINRHINEVLEEAGLNLNGLHAISVCGGPGSYTGLRIGLSTAKALCYVQDIPLMQHDRLLLLALNGFYKFFSEYEQYAAIIPAREKEYFIAIYSDSLATVMPARHMFQDDMIHLLDENRKKMFVTGEVKDELGTADNSQVTFTPGTLINIEYWAKYAFIQYKGGFFSDLSLSEPYYLKQVYTHK